MTLTELDEIELHGSMDRPYGISYAAWTTKWWEWIMPFTNEKSPLNDHNGELWDSNQPSSDVWFLIGNYAKEYKAPYKDFPQRKIERMRAGRSILFPVLNCMSTFLEDKEKLGYETHEDLLGHVCRDVDSVVKKEVFINYKRYEPVRLQTEPKIFKVPIVENNAFEIKNYGITEAAAEGYWVFLRPLPMGHYTIRFEASCENGRLSAGASYEIDIV
jgi:hypothetical protein